VYEKARDDYAKRFNDAGLPEACVADILRGRAVCEEGDQQLALEELLGESFQICVEGEGDAVREVDTGGELVTLELVRTKNKCSSETVGAPDGTRNAYFVPLLDEKLRGRGALLLCADTCTLLGRPNAFSEFSQ
jgi:hypothetical protein